MVLFSRLSTATCESPRATARVRSRVTSRLCGRGVVGNRKVAVVLLVANE
jgi:hypothetical protein